VCQWTSVEIWQSYGKNNFAQFFSRHGVLLLLLLLYRSCRHASVLLLICSYYGLDGTEQISRSHPFVCLQLSTCLPYIAIYIYFPQCTRKKHKHTRTARNRQTDRQTENIQLVKTVKNSHWTKNTKVQKTTVFIPDLVLLLGYIGYSMCA